MPGTDVVLFGGRGDDPVWAASPVADRPSGRSVSPVGRQVAATGTGASDQLVALCRELLATGPVRRLARDGQLVRVVNLRTEQLTRSKDGLLLGWSRGAQGRSAVQARLQRVGRPPLMPTPAALLMLANVVAGTAWQQQLSGQLDALQSSVAGIRLLLDAQIEAKLSCGVQRLTELTVGAHDGLNDAALNSDPVLADAVQAAVTLLVALERRVGAPDTTAERMPYARFVARVEGQESEPGLLADLVGCRRAVEIAQAIDGLRFDVKLAAGNTAAARSIEAEAAQRRQRLIDVSERISGLAYTRVRLPVDVRHSVPRVGPERQERHRQHTEQLRTHLRELTVDVLRRPASADPTVLLLRDDGQVLLESG